MPRGERPARLGDGFGPSRGSIASPQMTGIGATPPFGPVSVKDQAAFHRSRGRLLRRRRHLRRPRRRAPVRRLAAIRVRIEIVSHRRRPVPVAELGPGLRREDKEWSNGLDDPNESER